MADLVPYLTFDGQCADAMSFYAKTLGGEVVGIMTAAQTPMAADIGPGFADHVMHACIEFDGRRLMASDSMGQPYNGMQGMWVSLHYTDPAEARRIFAALGEGGKVTMPIDKTFWAEAFGMLVDRFGTPWMINCEPTS